MIKLFMLFVAFPFLISAGHLNDNLNKFFNDLNSSGNYSHSDVYKGQRAGHMTGGGLALRNRVTSDKVATITPPKFDAGCGGIDIYAGGMSFISGRQIENQLKSIGSNAIGYAFLLGIETVSPQSSNIMKQLQSWANTINGININSCETASALVGSVWPKQTLASQQICRANAGKSGYLTDYVNGRHQCANKSEYNRIMRQMENENPDLLKEEFNLAWEAIKRQGGCPDDDDKELFMSLMGTIIVLKDENSDGRLKRIVIPSKINDNAFLQALLNGGTANTLVCNKQREAKRERCLYVTNSPNLIPYTASWIGKIESKLTNMQKCILNDEPLSEEDQKFLAKSRLPLYKIINALTAYKRGYCPVEIFQVANIIAMDLLMQYLRESIDIVRSGCVQLKGTELYSDDIDEYLKNLAWVENKISQHELHNRDLLMQEQHMMQLIEKIEQQLSSEVIIR